MEFQKRYKQLNAAQRQAVDTIDGPVMVIAGPGTGKTELLSVRVANILQQTDTLPENILLLTFTDSGAAAMRERLIGIIGKDAYKIAIHTFHSFGSEIINQNREYFYQGAMFQPADDLSRYEIMRGIFDELEYKNPLATTMNGEYVHLSDATQVISELKRSGLTSDELLTVIEENEAAVDDAERILVPIISGSVSVKMRDALQAALPELAKIAKGGRTLFEVVPLARVIYDGLAFALAESETIHPTKPITAWKAKWFAKNTEGGLGLKSRAHHRKLRALAFVYYEYLTRMEQAGLYDYDDMILQVVHAMEVHDDLRYNLQEKYLYMMVDEFQDTNLAQMRILHNLTNNPANDEKPNILVVGDDDQAIYSFQGADISNILSFQKTYPAAQLVVLTDNYRSSAPIVESARDVITLGSQRLENLIEEVNKQLTAHNDTAGKVEIFHAPTVADERSWLAEAIAKDIKQGTQPSNITVLTRRHSEIQSLLPYFSRAGIAVSYEARDNVLDLPPIAALIQLTKVVVALGEGRHDQANEALPQLLAHPAWGLTPTQLWRLSSSAYDNRRRWMDEMATQPEFLPIHTWLIELAAPAQQTPLEQMLDRMMGRPRVDEEAESFSPFFTYYFSGEKQEKNPADYLQYLEGLRIIRNRLCEHYGQTQPTLQSLLDFVQLYQRLNMTLPLTRVAAEGNPNAINIMTAHKSKGQEFDTVYIFNGVDNVWGEKARSRSRLIGYPENLPLAPAGETSDERLRLFYVAMTRAKRRLIMSYSDANDQDKITLVGHFLSGSSIEVVDIDPSVSAAEKVTAAELAWYQPLIEPSADLQTLLKPMLQTYKLSATHLNNFLDVTSGGPRQFLLDNLLHFPSTKSASASYGSAVHKALQQAHTHLSATGERKPLEDVLRDFEVALKQERLSVLDFDTYLQKGSEQLQAFLDQKYATFSPTQKVELNFAGQEVVLGDAQLSGMLDLVDFNTEEKTMIVTDYKTGKPATSWKANSEHDKIKLYKYRQQLLFYKLLVENSRDYGKFTVEQGCLQFVEPTQAGEITTLKLEFDREELAHVSTLIAKVWQRITTLDLPDTSSYDASIKGILAFEDDLLNDRI